MTLPRPFRRFTTVFAFAAVAVTIAPAAAQLRLSAERVAAESSLFAASPPGDHHRLFTISQNGQVRVVKDGVRLSTLFLNVSSMISVGSEAGLLGLAFHPQFSENGYAYIYYATGMDVTLARYTVNPENPDVADPASAIPILKIPRSAGIHYGGWTAFGPDGYLYIAVGNAGGPSNSQSMSILLGKLLRIDVDHDDFPADPNRNYRIPPTNPFVITPPGAPEIWAYGLRNPWRCSFDRMTGDLWIGDVGDGREEIDFQPAAGPPPYVARNYGYSCMEGSVCGSFSSGCVCGQSDLILPIIEYIHTLGSAVIGGYVYRGTRIPALQGAYLFGDYTSGHRWSFRWTAGGGEVGTVEISGLASQMFSFSEDADGELYVCGSQGVYRIIPLCPANCDASLAPPVLNVNDFQCFINKFAAGSSDANCDGSTALPTLNANDFQCFMSLYAAGCP